MVSDNHPHLCFKPEVSMAIREGRWDCQYCGEVGILGRHKVCPNCAHSRPEGTKFYLPPEEEVVEEAGLQQQARLGPDWICEYCSSSNPADLTVCRHCNAPREATTPEQQVKSYDLGEVPTAGDMDLDTPPERQPPPPPPQQRLQRKWLLPAIAAVALLCLGLLGFLLFRTDNVPVTVDNVNWQRTIQVQALQTVTEEGWQVPDGGRILDQREEIHHYDQEIVGYETKQRQVSERVQVGERTYVCGQEDLGNGFFQDVECTEPVYETQSRTESYEDPVYRQVPVYQTLYTYEVDRWTDTRLAQAGGDDHRAYWPETALAANEREGERGERYQIVFVDEDGNRYPMDFDEEEWLTFEAGGSYQLKVNQLGNPIEVIQ